MQVILLQRVPKLGQMGEVVKVRDGYARNFLLPQGKALRASAANIAGFEARKADLEAHNLETRREAEAAGARIDGQTFVVIRSASDAGALYGSVSARDVCEVAAAAGFVIERGQIDIGRPIKELGLHKVAVVLHPEVTVGVTLNVARSVEEAEVQAAGKSMRELAAEADAAAESEIAELLEDIGSAASDED